MPFALVEACSTSGAGFEPATSGLEAFGPSCSPDYEPGALSRLGYPGIVSLSATGLILAFLVNGFESGLVSNARG